MGVEGQRVDGGLGDVSLVLDVGFVGAYWLGFADVLQPLDVQDLLSQLALAS